MNIRCFEVGPMAANAWVLTDAGECLVLDPGGESDALLDASCESEHIRVFLTHGHIDHIAGLRPYIKRGCAIYIGEEDAAAPCDANVNLSAHFGMPFSFKECNCTIARGGDELRLGGITFRVVAGRGRIPGSICLYGAGHLFSGDVLFNAGIGRTDFPGGDAMLLEKSIREKLFVLPDDTIVHPGHGPVTTIGAEKLNFHIFFP
jgi:glyoxylase-like metal-dependent hydrolase (beta-lactamase superfamily II)